MWSVLLVLISCSTWASPSFRSVKTQAQQIFLTQGRSKALAFLAEKIEESPKDKEALIGLGEKLGSRFVSEMAQREFESAESIYFSEQKGYEAHYEKAQEKEPANLKISYALIRNALRLGNCSKAKSEIEALDVVWPHAAYKKYFDLLLKTCRGEKVFFHDLKPIKEDQELAPIMKAFRVKTLIAEGRLSEAEKLLGSLNLKDMAYAELYFLKFDVNLAFKMPSDLSLLKKYLSLCQSYGPLDRRRYQLDITLCRRIDEANKLMSQIERADEL